MIDGDKKVVSKQPFVSFPKVNSNSLQSILRVLCQNRIDLVTSNLL